MRKLDKKDEKNVSKNWVSDVQFKLTVPKVSLLVLIPLPEHLAPGTPGRPRAAGETQNGALREKRPGLENTGGP